MFTIARFWGHFFGRSSLSKISVFRLTRCEIWQCHNPPPASFSWCKMSRSGESITQKLWRGIDKERESDESVINVAKRHIIIDAMMQSSIIVLGIQNIITWQIFSKFQVWFKKKCSLRKVLFLRIHKILFFRVHKLSFSNCRKWINQIDLSFPWPWPWSTP